MRHDFDRAFFIFDATIDSLSCEIEKIGFV